MKTYWSLAFAKSQRSAVFLYDLGFSIMRGLTLVNWNLPKKNYTISWSVDVCYIRKQKVEICGTTLHEQGCSLHVFVSY